MLPSPEYQVQKLLSEIGTSENLSPQEMNNLYYSFFSNNYSPFLSGEVITFDAENKALLSTKTYNLKFRLFDLLISLAETSTSVLSSPKSTIELILIALRLFQKLKALSTIKLSEADAAILYTSYLLVRENKEVTIDSLLSTLRTPYTQEFLLLSLDNLSTLGCIEFNEKGIKIIEVVAIS